MPRNDAHLNCKPPCIEAGFYSTLPVLIVKGVVQQQPEGPTDVSLGRRHTPTTAASDSSKQHGHYHKEGRHLNRKQKPWTDAVAAAAVAAAVRNSLHHCRQYGWQPQPSLGRHLQHICKQANSSSSSRQAPATEHSVFLSVSPQSRGGATTFCQERLLLLLHLPAANTLPRCEPIKP